MPLFSRTEHIFRCLRSRFSSCLCSSWEVASWSASGSSVPACWICSLAFCFSFTESLRMWYSVVEEMSLENAECRVQLLWLRTPVTMRPSTSRECGWCTRSMSPTSSSSLNCVSNPWTVVLLTTRRPVPSTMGTSCAAAEAPAPAPSASWTGSPGMFSDLVCRRFFFRFSSSPLNDRALLLTPPYEPSDIAGTPAGAPRRGGRRRRPATPA
mmetsp:Transcript_97687/g.254603  ORF Transcript_97687/g.254603 Transcript_97687/m.254603 type:complete len:211 (+) Transcript_97687:181-813(+)